MNKALYPVVFIVGAVLIITLGAVIKFSTPAAKDVALLAVGGLLGLVNLNGNRETKGGKDEETPE
jgi:hypothetical protein